MTEFEWLTCADPKQIRLKQLMCECGRCRGCGLLDVETGLGNEHEGYQCHRCGGAGVARPEWLTPTVQAIAETVYRERQWELMPILGDALEDAGCTDPAVLNHCRGLVPCATGCKKAGSVYMAGGKRCPSCQGSNGLTAAMHVRGCWVIDLLLGKD